MPKKAKRTTALVRRKPVERPPAARSEVVLKPTALDDAAAAYAGASRAENTKRAYTTDFVAFFCWCEPQQLAAMPALPRTVALYLTALACAERTVATIERALVAISQAHKLHGFESPRKAPEVTEVLQGIRRTIGVAPKQKDPVLVDTLRALVEPMRRRTPATVGTELCCASASPAAAGAPCSSPWTSRTSTSATTARGHHPSVQDGPGGPGAQCGHPVRRAAPDVPGEGGAGLDRPVSHRQGPPVSPRLPLRQDLGVPTDGAERGPRRQEVGPGGRL